MMMRRFAKTNSTSRRTTLCVSALLASAVTTAGCNTTINDLKTGQPFYHDWPIVGRDGGDEPVPYPYPVKMATTWAPDTLVQSGHTPTRGFGGRIYFYDEKSNAVPVDGKLVIHGFDDTGGGDPADIRRFEFTPEQFTRHFSQSDLGASYSIWVPWDAVGGDQKRISLVGSFRTVGGKIVQGEPATILLPGRTDVTSAQRDDTLFSAQYQRHRGALAAGQTSRGMTTTTIAKGKKPSKSSEQTSDPIIAGVRSGQLQVRTAAARLPSTQFRKSTDDNDRSDDSPSR